MWCPLSHISIILPFKKLHAFPKLCRLFPSLIGHTTKSKALVKFSKSRDIDSAFTRLTSEVENILETQKFPKLRRACIQRINSLGSNLPQSLVPKIQCTSNLDEMLDVLAPSPYWNWFDTRLLQALVSASGSPEAEDMLEVFKATFHTKKISEVMPYIIIKPFKEFIELVEKFDKDPKDLTVSELLKHKYKLEYEILDIDEGELVLSCIRTGCVELRWQVREELLYRVYTSMKKKHDKLSSFAIKSLVCEAADEFIEGLPVLLRGQEVEEVGPIEPLPEHVRQEPYSLPQGFHWVTLTSSDAKEIVRFSLNQQSYMDYFKVNYNMNYPNTKAEWQFAIRTLKNELIGVVVSRRVHICVGGTSIICMYPNIAYLLKYRKRRLFYMLNKELMRRVNLSNINQFIIFSNSLLKPVTTYPIWRYHFNRPAASQLPSSPRTPGWRRMTSEDVPSALALINKWSSQFEIRQVFDSEEELAHYLLCPILPNYVLTYVVQNEIKHITDLVRFLLYSDESFANITTVVSTHTPVKDLILDALVCARNNGVTSHATVHQYSIKHDVLLSLSFQQVNQGTCHIYNYKYHEIPHKRFWFTI